MPRRLQPCGTRAAYQRHLKADGYVTCFECLMANARYQAEWFANSFTSGGGGLRPSGSVLYTPQPCGTAAAYQRHRKHGEEACDACKAAWAEQARERYARASSTPEVKPAMLKPCGTVAAYRRHRRAKEMACAPCLEANLRASAIRRAKQRAAWANA